MTSSKPARALQIHVYNVGYINWGGTYILPAIQEIRKWTPVAAWCFGPKDTKDLVLWVKETSEASSGMKIWVQVGIVAMALAVAEAFCLDMFMIQGADVVGYESSKFSSIMTLLPRFKDALEGVALVTLSSALLS